LGWEISLRDLAALAQLSPFHFARAFKQCEPPHRYHMVRRIELAKALLKVPAPETNSFTTAFRRSVGTIPIIASASPKDRLRAVSSAQFQSRHRKAQQALSRTIIT
jgi:AraC-like DNA-binding protein